MTGATGARWTDAEAQADSPAPVCEEVGKLFDSVFWQIAHAIYSYEFYRQLYLVGEERRNLLHRISPSGFGTIAYALRRDLIVSISCVLDPVYSPDDYRKRKENAVAVSPVVGKPVLPETPSEGKALMEDILGQRRRPHRNASLESLAVELHRAGYGEAARGVLWRTLCVGANAAGLRFMRDKVIAHADYATMLGDAEAIGVPDRAALEDIINGLVRAAMLAAEVCRPSALHTTHSISDAADNALALISALARERQSAIPQGLTAQGRQRLLEELALDVCRKEDAPVWLHDVDAVLTVTGQVFVVR